MPRLLAPAGMALLLAAGALAAPAAAERLQLGRRTYFLHVPEGVSRPALVVWCHPGNGRAQPEFDWLLQTSRVLGSGNVVFLAPQAASTRWTMASDEDFVLEVIEKAVAEHGVDRGKILLGGHSSGAIFTYALGLAHPRRFHALFPNAGRLEVRRPPATEAGQGPLIYILHSSDDNVVPFFRATQARDTLRRLGYAVSFFEDRQGHNLGPQTVGILDALVQILERFPPSTARLFGGFHGLRVLTRPADALLLRSAPGQQPGEPRPVADPAPWIRALLETSRYLEAPVAASTGEPTLTLRLRGEEAELEVRLGLDSRRIEVVLDERTVGIAGVDPATDGLWRLVSGEAGQGGRGSG